jgi:hypothetical protein
VKGTSNKRVAVFVVLHVVITTLTWHDLRNRPVEKVRGSKKVWRMASGLNTLGSVAYWGFGRRR